MARVPQKGERYRGPPPPEKPIWPDHCCPGCGKPQRAYERYPWYFCQKCIDGTTDCSGRKLAFTNSTMFGGLTWYFADDSSLLASHATTALCFIHRRVVRVCEARMGGVVAEPLAGDWRAEGYDEDRLADFTWPGGVEKASAWLKPAHEHPMNPNYRPPAKPIDPAWWETVKAMKPVKKPDNS